ncbi:MAG: 4-hydroxy-3-methylbut-2-enyl diphosphate reductase [Candidatus Cloacimonetes bacterium]|nr:4-hydroxy-3-methylbut-2-enyl diphosphate reductase [Candidatus Cloacimonadota bacterium]
MIIRIAKNSGFCFGVKRAIKIALEAAEENHEINTLGPIIHNPQMVEKLEEKGIKSIDDIKLVRGKPVIIRSHGVEKSILEKLRQNGTEIINATCPYVSKTQQYAAKLSKDGYQVIIMGNQDHPEVIALKSYVEGEAIIVSDEKDLPDKKLSRVGIISQTTRNIKDLQNLVNVLLPRCSEMLVINTICNATMIRQNSTLKLAKESDVMIVIGGKNSSNTKMLAKISENFVETFHIETASELNADWFRNKTKIGITAGASTPDWIIVEVYNKILECKGNIADKVTRIEDIPGFKEENNG